MCTTRSAGGILLAELQRAGVEHISLGRRHRLDVLPSGRLARFLGERRIEILHSHKFGSNVWAVAVQAIFRAAPVMVAQEHGWSYERRARRLIDGQLIGRVAKAFVAGTRADAERMVSRERVPASKVVVIPGAYIRRPQGKLGDLRGELGLAANVPVIATIGVLRPEKAYDVLIQAFALLRRRLPDAHLVIAGDGECRDELRATHRKPRPRLGDSLPRHARRHRHRSACRRRRVDRTMPARGTSLFALECMAHEVPLVSTRVGGPAEFLEHGVSALLVEPGNPAELALALESLARDATLRSALARAAREQLDGFEIDQIAARHGALYERLLDGHARAMTGSSATY